MATAASAHLRDEPQLFLADLILAETVYVVESLYETLSGQVVEIARSLLALMLVTKLTSIAWNCSVTGSTSRFR